MAELSAFELLDEMRTQAIKLLGEAGDYAQQASGTKNIAYKVNDINFFCSAALVHEVASCESLSVVPQTKKWLRGLINSKGVLYSVTDLALFAGFDRPIQEGRGHLLLLSDQEQQSALLVNRVIGFRYFDEQQRLVDFPDSASVPEGLSNFVDKAYTANDENWFQLDIKKLLNSEQFKEVQ